MSPAHVLEPTYDALRRRLLDGAWSPGLRLEAARLAADLGVSITPVRDSLNRLTGERLVVSSPGDGFHVPPVDEAELRDLLSWHHSLVTRCLSGRPAPSVVSSIPHGHDGIAERTRLLFSAVAGLAGNAEIIWAIGNAGARLSRYRRDEDDVMGSVGPELDRIEDHLLRGDRVGTLRTIGAYHRRRATVADRIVRAIRARAPGPAA